MQSLRDLLTACIPLAIYALYALIKGLEHRIAKLEGRR